MSIPTYHKNFMFRKPVENILWTVTHFNFIVYFLAELNCFVHIFCIKNPNQLVLVAKFLINLALAAIKISDHLEQVGFWIFFVFVVLIDFGFALALGFDICGNPENDPPQQLEQQQQGKQFDHVNPITFKSNILFSIICIYALPILC